MKNYILLATLVLAMVPTLNTQARIEKPEVQFKTLEQIQADALSKSEMSDLTEDQKRQQRLLKLTRSSNTGTGRVKSAKESFKKSRTTKRTSNSATGSTINKQRSFRGTRVRHNASTYSKPNETREGHSTRFASDISTTIRARLRARLAAKENMKTESEADKVYADFTPEPGQEWGR